MAIGHAVRGAATAALTLIALEAITTTGSGRVASFATDVSALLARAISPDVPLIRDRRSTAAPAAGSDGMPIFHMTPAQTAAVAQAAQTAGPVTQAVNNPNSLINQLAGMNLAGIQNYHP